MELRNVRRDNSTICFQFRYNSFFDDKVQPMLSDHSRSIPDPDRLFTLHLESAVFQFRNKCSSINAFQKSRSQATMNTTSSLHDPVGQPFKRFHRLEQCNSYTAVANRQH